MRESFQGFISPKSGFAIFAEFDQHADLASPGGGALGIKFEHLGIEAEGGLKIAVFKSRAGFGHVVGIVFEQPCRFAGLLIRFASKFQIAKTAHDNLRPDLVPYSLYTRS